MARLVRHWLGVLNLAVGVFLAGALAAPVLAALGWRRPRTACTRPTTSPATSGRSGASSCSASSRVYSRAAAGRPGPRPVRLRRQPGPGLEDGVLRTRPGHLRRAAAGRAALRPPPRPAPVRLRGCTACSSCPWPGRLHPAVRLARKHLGAARGHRPAVRAGQRLAGPAAPGRRIRTPASRQHGMLRTPHANHCPPPVAVAGERHARPARLGARPGQPGLRAAAATAGHLHQPARPGHRSRLHAARLPRQPGRRDHRAGRRRSSNASPTRSSPTSRARPARSRCRSPPSASRGRCSTTSEVDAHGGRAGAHPVVPAHAVRRRGGRRRAHRRGARRSTGRPRRSAAKCCGAPA